MHTSPCSPSADDRPKADGPSAMRPSVDAFLCETPLFGQPHAAARRVHCGEGAADADTMPSERTHGDIT
jgi:hypothetical protein